MTTQPTPKPVDEAQTAVFARLHAAGFACTPSSTGPPSTQRYPSPTFDDPVQRHHR